MQIQPYLFFNGCCDEAIDFYCKVVDARLGTLMRYKESPEPPPPDKVPPGYDDKVMHAELHIGDSVVMVSDGCAEGPAFQGFSLALSVADVAEAARRFKALGEGGEVTMPMSPTFWSPGFGMLVDRFGVSWMVMAVQPEPGTRS